MSFFDQPEPDLDTLEDEGCEECQHLQRELQHLNELMQEQPSAKLRSFADVYNNFDSAAARRRDNLAKEHRELMYEIREHNRRKHSED